MVLRFTSGDGSEQIRRLKAIASGGIVPSSDGSGSSFGKSTAISHTFSKTAQLLGAGSNVIMTQPMFFSPLHTPQNWQIASKRREIYQWARFYYENEPKVAAGVDFYAQFPLNGFTLECKNRRILKYYEQFVKDINLSQILRYIAHEYFLLGDVFPFLEITCPKCHGGGIDTDTNDQCNHPDGTFNRVVILNPDYIDAQGAVLGNDPTISLVPDEELKSVISRRWPAEVFEKIPPHIIDLIQMGHPIQLSNRSVSHIRLNASPYGTFGTSILRRLFTILAYKTKLMTANWIVAERMILPIRVVKVGEKDRPATDDDIADIQNQLATIANDPNLTLVTHHAFDYEWYGATGKIHNITTELEQIGKEILDGLMLNQAILNGEAPGYNSAAVGVEILISRLDSWRDQLAEWVHKHLFLPIAMMQGFIDEEESNMMGRPVFLYPTIKWNDLNLRDNSNKVQIMMQGYDKGMVSAQSILEEMNLDYDTEIQRIREEQVVQGAAGLMGQGGMGDMGMGGGMGGMSGFGGPPPGDMGAMGGDMGMGGMGGAPGGDMGMGGAPGGGMGGGMGAAAGGQPPFISKRGKGTAPGDEQQSPQVQLVKLTSLERKMMKMLQSSPIPYGLFAQYKVALPGEQQPFLIDFAYPQVGVGVEADGQMWHENAEMKQRDDERDNKLAGAGWRILRFREDAITDKANMIQDIVYENVVEAAEEHKQRYRKAAESDNPFIKVSSTEDFFEEIDMNRLNITYLPMPDGLGEVVFFDTE